MHDKTQNQQSAWMDNFSDVEQRLIANIRQHYATTEHRGTIPMNDAILVKMADLLDSNEQPTQRSEVISE